MNPHVSDEQIEQIVGTVEDTNWNDFVSVGKQVRDLYEPLVTSQKERIAALEADANRMRDALHELADAVLWCHDDADYKAPEQFTKPYVFGRYLNRMAQIATACKELHPKPSPKTTDPK